MQKEEFWKCICLLCKNEQTAHQRTPRLQRSLNEVRRLLGAWDCKQKKRK